MEYSGTDNVTSSLFGRGAVNDIASGMGRFVVTTMEVPWRLVQDRIGGRPEAVHFVDSMEFELVESEIASLPDCDVVLAIGGGRAIDFGKYMAWKRGCRLVSIPSVLSVDAFVTPQAGLRRSHRVEYVGHASPDPLIIDYDLLRTAPSQLNIAGTGDLLSIHTATFDWELAIAAGKSEYEFSSDDVDMARSIVESVSEQAQEIRACTDKGLRTIVDGYLNVNRICLPAGHYRVEEGSEHFLFYELEERLRRPFIHGQIVGLGIFIMSHLQENQADTIAHLMGELGLDYRPASMEIEKEDLLASLLNLRHYVEKTDRWYSVINERDISRQWAEGICELVYKTKA